MAHILKEQWSYTSTNKELFTVVPDGCKDIVIKQNQLGHVHTVITPLASSAYQVNITANTNLIGFRLSPGTRINERKLFTFIQNNSFESLQKESGLAPFCYLSSATKEALEGLCSDLISIELIAKNLGVSIRTLQRHVKEETGKTPKFWQSLAKVRRCARLLAQSTPLIESAIITNYSDQSHMAREVQRWFGCTPSAIQNGQLKAEILLSGYD